MIKFYFKRNFKDLFGHFILIVLPIALIVLLHFINTSNFGDSLTSEAYNQYTILLSFGFILMFQIYGSALSFDGLYKDFYTGIKDRLMASPIDLRGIALANILTSSIVNLVQSIAIFIVSLFVLGMKLDQPLLVILVIIGSVIFNQLFGVLLLFITKKASTTQTIITIYGVLAPILMGLYFPLPDNEFLNTLKDYGTPTSLAFTAINATNTNDLTKYFICFGALIGLTLLVFLLYKPFIRKVTYDI